MFGMAPGLTPRQKAAVVVRMMLADGAELDLSSLPPDLQALLTQEMSAMPMVDRSTCDAVLTEFCEDLERIGVTFPAGMDGTLDLLGPRLSPDTANRLRRIAAMNGTADPWERVAALPAAQLAQVAAVEAVEVTAVMFSRLPVARASEVFALLDATRAREIAFAMSLTGGIEAPALHRIGLALMRAVDALPRPAMEAQPVEKVGALLNLAPAATRDTVLAGLDEDDADFAGQVRRAIFTWANIPARIDKRDIPRIVREIEGPVLLKALAGATGPDEATTRFLLDGLSSRLGDSMREDMAAQGTIKAADAEAAMAEVVATIRRMEAAGELFLLTPTDDAPITIGEAG